MSLINQCTNTKYPYVPTWPTYREEMYPMPCSYWMEISMMLKPSCEAASHCQLSNCFQLSSCCQLFAATISPSCSPVSKLAIFGQLLLGTLKNP